MDVGSRRRTESAPIVCASEIAQILEFCGASLEELAEQAGIKLEFIQAHMQGAGDLRQGEWTRLADVALPLLHAHADNTYREILAATLTAEAKLRSHATKAGLEAVIEQRRALNALRPHVSPYICATDEALASLDELETHAANLASHR